MSVSAVLDKADMQKEYGKLTADQFKEFIDKLPEVNKQRNEFGRLLSELPKEKFDALMVSGFNWAEIYEGACPRCAAFSGWPAMNGNGSITSRKSGSWAARSSGTAG